MFKFIDGKWTIIINCQLLAKEGFSMYKFLFEYIVTYVGYFNL